MNASEELAKFLTPSAYETVAQHIDSRPEDGRAVRWQIAVRLAMAGTTAQQMTLYGIRQVYELATWDERKPDPLDVADAWCAVHNSLGKEAGPVAGSIVAAVRDRYRRTR